MRLFLTILIGAVGGFLLGIALSSFIGMLGMTLFEQEAGINYLPVIIMVIGAAAVPLIDRRAQNKR